MVADLNTYRSPQLEKVASSVAQAFNLTSSELRSPSRRGDIAEARFAAYHLARSKFNISLTAIASYFNRNCHGSVSSGIAAATMRLECRNEKRFQALYERASKNLEHLTETQAGESAAAGAVSGQFDLDHAISLLEQAKLDVATLQTTAAKAKLAQAMASLGEAMFQIGSMDSLVSKESFLCGGGVWPR